MSNELQYPLTDLKKVIHKWFYIEDDRIIDVIMAVYVANRFNADPIWLIIIAPPSNTKTELLRAFDGHKNAFFLSNLTPSTLVSGKTSKKSEPSLLPKLNDKMVIIKDFTTILSMRSENRQEILAQLRETYDGQYSKSFGTGKTFDWTGKFGLIAACTPVYDSHYSVIGSMGERFVLYRSENMSGVKMGLQAQKIVGQEDKMRAEIKKAIHKFINQFNSLKNVEFNKNEEVNNMVISLACFCAYARCPVERDRYTQAVKYDPMPEGTPRLVKQFMQLGMGLALIHGKNSIDTEIYETIKKIGRDLMPAHRLKILWKLWDLGAYADAYEWPTTKEIAEAVNRPTTTTKLLLEDLMIAGVLNRDTKREGKSNPYTWQLTDEIFERIGQAEIFDEV